MNEPYNRVHTQEKSNSTLGTISTHVALGLGTSALYEGGIVAGAKFINPQKSPRAHSFFHNAAYSPGLEGSKGIIKMATSGLATRHGRIMNYGTTAIGGIISGLLASNMQKE